MKSQNIFHLLKVFYFTFLWFYYILKFLLKVFIKYTFVYFVKNNILS